MGTTKRSRAAASDDKTSQQSTRTKTQRTQRSHVSKTQGEEKVGATKKEKNLPETFPNETKIIMRQFAYQVVQAGVHTLRMKYAELKGFVPADPAKTHFEQNAAKCRYKDVPCWDKTRVVLTWPASAQGDFIHANRVTHEMLDNQQIICCQGPLDATVPDFWRMVWQEKVRQIIMLCRTQEMGKDKCAQYWPNVVGNSMSYHGLTIKCEKVDQSDRSFIHHKLHLTCGNDSRNIDHRLFFAWPDKSVPKTPMAPFRLLQFSRRSAKHPTIIHCSAGVGRTGTLVLIELMYKSLLRNKIPDVFQMVKDLRSQRSQAVQTEDQYLYCHYAILQLLHVKNAAPSHFIKHFVKEYENYLKLLNDIGGKNLPLQATSYPGPCATCPKVVAHMNDARPDAKEMASPPSEKKETDRKESARESRRERPAQSVKESKRETRHNSNKENDPDKKATIMKRLKAQQKEDKTRRPGKKISAEVIEPGAPENASPSNTPLCTQPTAMETSNPQPEDEKKDETKKEELKKEEPRKDEVTKKEQVTEKPAPAATCTSPMKLPNQSKEPLNNPPHAPTPEKEKAPEVSAAQPPPPAAASSGPPPSQAHPPVAQTQAHPPVAQSQAHPPVAQPLVAAHPPAAPPQAAAHPPVVAAAAAAPASPPPAAEKPAAAPPTVPPAPVAGGPAPAGNAAASKYMYKAPTTYTIQQAGGKKAIVYHRSNTPFVKALATPVGVPQPQVMVNNGQPTAATTTPSHPPEKEKQQTPQAQPTPS